MNHTVLLVRKKFQWWIVSKMNENVLSRFWSKVYKTNSCWEWLACKDKDGYGHFKLKNKNIAAHRVAYELINGKIPEELEIDHLCHNRKCVNPNHMETVTHKTNIKRGSNATRTHCIHGHLFNNENTYIWKEKQRTCKICAKNRIMENKK